MKASEIVELDGPERRAPKQELGEQDMEDSKLEPLPQAVTRTLPTSREIAALLNSINEFIRNLERELRDAERGGVEELAKAFVVMHRLNTKLDDTAKRFAIVYEAYKTDRIPFVFEMADVPNVPLKEGFRVGTQTRLYASIRKNAHADAYEWLKSQRLGDLIIQTVNSSSLSAAIKELMVEKGYDAPSELFNVALTTSATVTKLK